MRQRVAKALRSCDDADEVLHAIGRLDRELGKIEDRQNKLIDRIKAETKINAEPCLKEKQALELELEQFCTSRLDEFRSVRSKRLTFGTVSFRLSSKVTIRNIAQTLLALKGLWLLHCIRVKEEPDKEELKKLTSQQLTGVGCKLKTEDVFGYEVDQAKIVAAEDAA